MNVSKSIRMVGMSLLFAAAYGGAQAQQAELKVATGECVKDSCSTYVTMFRELKARCTGDLTLTEVQSKGSVESVDRLLNNEINAGIVQTDVLFWRRRTEDLNAVKTLVALHPEEIHFVAPADSGVKAGGIGVGSIRIKQEAVTFTQVDQLAGYRVGVVGNSGSMVTARLIRAEGNVNYEVVLFDNGDKLRAALDAGEVQAIVYVGGAPLPSISALDSRYKLLGFSPALITTLKDIYRPATLNYGKMNAAGIKSMATEANLVTREYKTPKMVAALSAFRSCALSAIDELKETTGTHKKWQAVQSDNKGKWPWYELPVAAVAKKK